MKKECYNHLYPDSDYFNTLKLISYLSAMETLTCRREMSLLGSTSFGFAQSTIHDFQNTVSGSKEFQKRHSSCRTFQKVLILL